MGAGWRLPLYPVSGRLVVVHALTGQQWFAVGLLAVVAFCVGGLVEVSRQAAYERRRACERHYR